MIASPEELPGIMWWIIITLAIIFAIVFLIGVRMTGEADAIYDWAGELNDNPRKVESERPREGSILRPLYDTGYRKAWREMEDIAQEAGIPTPSVIGDYPEGTLIHEMQHERRRQREH